MRARIARAWPAFGRRASIVRFYFSPGGHVEWFGRASDGHTSVGSPERNGRFGMQFTDALEPTGIIAEVAA